METQIAMSEGRSAENPLNHDTLDDARIKYRDVDRLLVRVVVDRPCSAAGHFFKDEGEWFAVIYREELSEITARLQTDRHARVKALSVRLAANAFEKSRKAEFRDFSGTQEQREHFDRRLAQESTIHWTQFLADPIHGDDALPTGIPPFVECTVVRDYPRHRFPESAAKDAINDLGNVIRDALRAGAASPPVLSPGQILMLGRAALESSDAARVALCARALDGDTEAIRECARLIGAS